MPGGTYFFTLVTFHRRTLFDTSSRLDRLHSIIRQVQRVKPFDLVAFCLLPDHIHLLMTIPENDSNYSLRMREIKRLSTLWMTHEIEGNADPIWQDKYWEHTIRDEKDLKTHFDYIHYNPVKHGLTEAFDGWKWSSFREYYGGNDKRYKMTDSEVFIHLSGDFGE